jgi:hypothetical protein
MALTRTYSEMGIQHAQGILHQCRLGCAAISTGKQAGLVTKLLLVEREIEDERSENREQWCPVYFACDVWKPLIGLAFSAI